MAVTAPGDLAVLAVESGLVEVDAFEELLVYAGLEPTGELPLRVNPFTPQEAAELLRRPTCCGRCWRAARCPARSCCAGCSASREWLYGRIRVVYTPPPL